MNILPCPMCGSPAELNSTGAAECYGKAWQTLWIECTKTLDPHCGMDMTISADFFHIRNGEDVIIEAWNKLDRKTK
jgi:hypothetical protein